MSQLDPTHTSSQGRPLRTDQLSSAESMTRHPIPKCQHRRPKCPCHPRRALRHCDNYRTKVHDPFWHEDSFQQAASKTLRSTPIIHYFLQYYRLFRLQTGRLYLVARHMSWRAQSLAKGRQHVPAPTMNHPIPKFHRCSQTSLFSPRKARPFAGLSHTPWRAGTVARDHWQIAASTPIHSTPTSLHSCRS